MAREKSINYSLPAGDGSVYKISAERDKLIKEKAETMGLSQRQHIASILNNYYELLDLNEALLKIRSERDAYLFDILSLISKISPKEIHDVITQGGKSLSSLITKVKEEIKDGK